MRFFVTGTDTDVGKSHISASIALGLIQKSQKVSYWKPVQTGGASVDRDAVKKLVFAGIADDSRPLFSELEEFSWFSLPASPDQAALDAGKPCLDYEALCHQSDTHLRELVGHDIVVEGAGGLLVPFYRPKSDGVVKTWLDYLDRWDDWVVVVGRTGLGTLNHTFLTVNALVRRGHRRVAVVLNGEKHAANEETLRSSMQSVCGAEIPLFHFPTTETTSDLASSSTALVGWLESIRNAQNNSDAANVRESGQMDLDFSWHPYTQHKAYVHSDQRPMFVTGAKGSMLEVDGHGWVEDGIGSWWSCLIGHGRPEVSHAIAKQQSSLDHVLYANTAHAPAAHLARRILDFAKQPKLKKVFYSDNGSTAVEVAMKMAFQFRKRSGYQNAHKFLSLSASYHGDTIGTMAVAGSDDFHADFEPLLFKPLMVSPKLSHPLPGVAVEPTMAQHVLEKESEGTGGITQVLEDHADEISGLIVEPLVQGAAGMWLHDRKWLLSLCEKARAKNIPVIFDEVFTGMGRLGSPLAAGRLGFEPDLVCLAKGLTAGAASMALTLATQEVFDCFQGDDLSNAFLHGHTFTGHPVACAASLACLDIYERESLVSKALELEASYIAWADKMADSPHIRNIRAIGSILAFELNVENQKGYYWSPSEKQRFMHEALGCGIFLRPLGTTVYLSPPLNVEVEGLLMRLKASISMFFNTRP